MPGWTPMSFGSQNDYNNGTGAWTQYGPEGPGHGGGASPSPQGPPPYVPGTNPFLNPEYTSGSGTDRANMVAAEGSYLMGRKGPQLTAQDTTGLQNARANQQSSLGLMQQAAMGQAPSIAQAQTYGAMGNNIAAMNAASQGRGGAAQAMAQGGGLMNNTAMQGAMSRSNEQAGYLNQYGQNTASLRGNDISQYGADTQQYLRGLGLSSQQGILNAQTNMQMQQQEMQNEINAASMRQAVAQQWQQKRNNDNQTAQQAATGYAKAMEGGMSASDSRLKTDVRRYRGIMDF